MLACYSSYHLFYFRVYLTDTGEPPDSQVQQDVHMRVVRAPRTSSFRQASKRSKDKEVRPGPIFLGHVVTRQYRYRWMVAAVTVFVCMTLIVVISVVYSNKWRHLAEYTFTASPAVYSVELRRCSLTDNATPENKHRKTMFRRFNKSPPWTNKYSSQPLATQHVQVDGTQSGLPSSCTYWVQCQWLSEVYDDHIPAAMVQTNLWYCRKQPGGVSWLCSNFAIAYTQQPWLEVFHAWK